MFPKITLAFIFAFTFQSFAQEPQVSVMTFKTWKEQQVLEAQNQSLRTSARLSALRSGKTAAAKDSSPVPTSSRIRKSENDSVTGAEKDLRRAQESLKAAGDLSIEDYVTIYLPTLHDESEALNALTQKSSKEELAEIVKVLVRNQGPTDAKRNGSTLADALSPSTRTHAP